jgi:hypothetical protein
MRRFVRSSLAAVCFLFFCPSLPADGVHSFSGRADSFSDSSINFTDADSYSVRGDSTFYVSGTFGSNEDHEKWLDDSEGHPGNAWGWRKDHHLHHHDGNNGWNFGGQDNDGADGGAGNTEITSSGGPSTPSVPEPSVVVLLSTALVVFLLKRATV